MKKSKPKHTRPLTDKGGEVRELTAEDFRTARPLRDEFPDLAEYARKRKAGRPKSVAPKRLQSFKLSPDVIEGIRNSGKGYNARVEAVLRQALDEGRI
jgi:uncharacterized protein (DUF4415 family)